MTTCVVYDKATDKPINIIIAELTDIVPEGCYLGELLPNTIWNGTELITQEIVTTTEEVVEEVINGK
jgi:hexokinase